LVLENLGIRERLFHADDGILLVDGVPSIRIFRDPRNRKICLVDGSHIGNHEELRFLDAPNGAGSLEADCFVDVEIRFLSKKAGSDEKSSSKLVQSSFDQFTSRKASKECARKRRPSGYVKIHSPVWVFR